MHNAHRMVRKNVADCPCGEVHVSWECLCGGRMHSEDDAIRHVVGLDIFFKQEYPATPAGAALGNDNDSKER